MLTGRRFRVEFTAEQAVFAERIGSVCRAVWNTGLEQRREYRRRGAWMNYQPQAKELADAKTEHRWLSEVPGHCLQQALMDLDKACRTHGTFRVRWRSGRRWAPSFRFPEGNKMAVEQLNRWHGRVKLPKLGWVKFRQSRSLMVRPIRSATLTKDGGALVCRRSWLTTVSRLWWPMFEPEAAVGCGSWCCGGGRDQRRAAHRPGVRQRWRTAAGGGAATPALPRSEGFGQPCQDPRGAGEGAGT